MKKIFITGATGLIGANLVVELLKEKKYRINLLYRKNSFHPFLKDKDINISYGDICNIDSLKRAIPDDTDIVIHLAGVISYNKLDKSKLYNVNYIGTKNILRISLIKKVKKFIYISSTAAIGFSSNQYELLNEDIKFNIKKYKNIAYMYTKFLAENEVLKYKNRMKVYIISPSTVIGKGDIHNNTSFLINKIKKGNIRFAPEGGNNFVNVEQVVKGIISLIGDNRTIKSGEKFIISGINLTYKDFFIMINEKRYIVIPEIIYYLIYPVMFLIEKIFILIRLRIPFSTEILKISFHYRYFDNSKSLKIFNKNIDKNNLSIKI